MWITFEFESSQRPSFFIGSFWQQFRSQLLLAKRRRMKCAGHVNRTKHQRNISADSTDRMSHVIERYRNKCRVTSARKLIAVNAKIQRRAAP